MKLFFTVAFVTLFHGVDSALTFYNDRDLYLAALDGANIIEATAARTPGQNWFSEAKFLRFGDFEQCGLTFQWSGDWTNTMQAIQIQFGEHGGDRGYGEESFEGDAIYWMGIKNSHNQATKIKTKYPFYAIGFDHAGSNSPEFGIKIPGEEIQYHEMVQVAGGANRAQFVGWISDGEPVSEFEIVSQANSWTYNQGIGFTNIAYATRDETAVTPVECENRNHASRTCWATGWGDPHLVTWDGLKYDVHAKGEVVMTRSLDSDFEIQARLQGLNEEETGGPALITGIVVKDPGFPTLQVNMASTSSATTQNFHGCPIDLYVDQQATNIFTWAGTQDARVTVEQGDCYKDETLIGLLGSPDGNYKNDWMTASNEVLPLPQGVSAFFFQDAYDYSVNNWCLQTASESFFAYESDKTFYSYAKCGNAYDPALETILEAVPAELSFCNGDIGCIMDGVSIGTEAAEDYLADPAMGKEMKAPEPVPTSGPTSGPTSTPIAPIVPAPTPPAPTPLSIAKAVPSDPIPAGSNGDPHFKTWKNEHFEFHGQCDLVLTRDKDFANGLGLEVHIRTKLVRFWSYIKSAAIRIGNDVLEVEGSADPLDEKNHYWVNFQSQAPDAESIGGFPLSIKSFDGHKKYFDIDLSSKFPGQKIRLKVYREFIAVQFKGNTEESFGNTVGMLGDYKTGKTFARDGATELHDFFELGNEWQVSPADDFLFHLTSAPQFPKRCVMPEDPQGQRKRRLDESTVSVEAAENACASLVDELDRRDCVYDILATQDLDMVGAF